MFANKGMKNVIFTDDKITCECGYTGNFKQMEKHFKNTWTFVKTDIVSGMNKHGHTRALN